MCDSNDERLFAELENEEIPMSIHQARLAEMVRDTQRSRDVSDKGYGEVTNGVKESTPVTVRPTNDRHVMFSPQAPSSTTTPPKPKVPKPPPQTFYCEVCKVTLNAQSQYDQHLAGTKHKRKLAGPTPQPQPAVKRTSDGTIVERKSGVKPTITPTITPTPAVNTISGGADPVAEAVVKNALGTLPKKRKVEINCDVCKIELTSEIHAKTHFEGKKHMKKVKEMEATSRMSSEGNEPKAAAFFCQFCNINLNSTGQVEAHRAGSKHQNAMAKSKGANSPSATGPGPKFSPARRFQQPQNKREQITCFVCTDRIFKSFQELQQHLISPEHKARVSKRGVSSNFVRASGGSYNGNRKQGQAFGQGPDQSYGQGQGYDQDSGQDQGYAEDQSFGAPRQQFGRGYGRGRGGYEATQSRPSPYGARAPPPPPPSFESPSYGY